MIGAAVAVLAALLAATGTGLADLYETAGRDLIHRLTGSQQALYYTGMAIVLVMPAVVGVFWGAPLVARELEAGTHRLAWNQSVTRARWLTCKLGLTGLVAVTAAGLTSLAVTWWSSPIDEALDGGGADVGLNFLPRIDPVTFGARGVVPLGYAAFALLLGVTLGMVVRRTVPAMAATLAILTAVQIAMPLWVRPHLAQPVSITVAFTAHTMANLGLDSVSQVDIGTPGAWVIAEQTLDASGQPAAHLPAAYDDCDSPRDCLAALAQAGYHQRITYQPAGNFWTLQWAEVGIYLVLAAVLGLFCFWWIRRRPT
ncbi:transporter [Streptomyces sp. NPDC046909]|uniref:transporter n=1 Tax=Streptomyces sp. NPDC046909 TaxID=3155617 RepID=UPI0033E3F603